MVCTVIAPTHGIVFPMHNVGVYACLVALLKQGGDFCIADIKQGGDVVAGLAACLMSTLVFSFGLHPTYMWIEHFRLT